MGEQPDEGSSAWVNCCGDSVSGSHPHRRCFNQTLRYNVTYALNDLYQSPTTRKYLACHELPLPGVGDAADAPAVVEKLQPLEAGEPTVFYLRHKAAEARSLGWSEEKAGEEQGWYRIVSSTGLVTASSGLADVTMYLPSSHNPPIVTEIEALDMATLERVSTVD